MDIQTAITPTQFYNYDFRPLMSYLKGMDYNFCKSTTYSFNQGNYHHVTVVLGISAVTSYNLLGSFCWVEGGVAKSCNFQISKQARRIQIVCSANSHNIANPESHIRMIVSSVYSFVHDKYVDKVLKDVKPPKTPPPRPILFAIKRTRNNFHDRKFVIAVGNNLFTQDFVQMCKRLKIQYT